MAFPVSSAAAAAAFAQFSSEAAREAPELRIKPPHHIFREDIVKCLEKAAGRSLDQSELALVVGCFALDVSALISWQEFESALLKMEERWKTQGVGPKRPFTNSRARLLAARKKGLLIPGGHGASSANAGLPTTSSQEIGWGHAAAAAAGMHDLKERHAPLKGSDVTAGGEGTSLSSYYGPALGRVF